MKIVDAAEIMDIPYENAKAIYRIYKQEGRTAMKVFKKKDNSISTDVYRIIGNSNN